MVVVKRARAYSTFFPFRSCLSGNHRAMGNYATPMGILGIDDQDCGEKGQHTACDNSLDNVPDDGPSK